MSDQVTWYIPYVHCGCIKVIKRTKKFFKGSEKSYEAHKALPQTETEAREAIKPFLKEAKSKKEAVSAEIARIEKQYQCNIDYFMDGDTHGIHEDFLEVSFSLGGYHFNYEID
jgi:hypothetical protein